MPDKIKLSELIEQIQGAIQDSFEGEAYWVSARISDVKKYEQNSRCYLKLEECVNGTTVAEIKAVFWANAYSEITKFEKLTKQTFKNGLEIICKVKVRFHKIYGLNLDVIQIDAAHTIGTLEIERQQTLDRLLKKNPNTIQLFDGVYRTFNNRLNPPAVIENIALITAPNSDGQRDFRQELINNKHGFTFTITEFLTTIQGENAHKLILDQLLLIKKSAIAFDAVAIVRGGGSQGDFKPFDNFELCNCVVNFPIPIYTGIGHDRNQSIVDMMAREQKTPTKVAALLVEHNFEFENELIGLKTRINDLVGEQLQSAKDQLAHARRIIKLSSPQAILNRGFAMISIDGKIVTNGAAIKAGALMQTIMKDETIYSTVNKKEKNGNRVEL